MKNKRNLLRTLDEQGFVVRLSTKGHLLILREGRVVASFAGTPSDWRSHRNSLAALRRAGFVGALYS